MHADFYLNLYIWPEFTVMHLSDKTIAQNDITQYSFNNSNYLIYSTKQIRVRFQGKVPRVKLALSCVYVNYFLGLH